MITPVSPPPSYIEDREALQRVATHVVARARHGATGRFGLRATPGGFGTPAFGDDVEVVRVAGRALVRERAGRLTSTPLIGTDVSLGGLATFAGVDLDAEFSAGGDTPPLGDRDAPLGLDPAGVAVVADWFACGALAIDRVLASLGEGSAPSVVQLWPEHFDLAADVAWDSSVPTERRANLGCSPGDDGHSAPYLYVGPWGPERPGDDAYWNASFGATLDQSNVTGADDPVAAAAAFYGQGVRLLAAR